MSAYSIRQVRMSGHGKRKTDNAKVEIIIAQDSC